MTFLRNHADRIASMDLFLVPTISFRMLYGLLILQHGRSHLEPRPFLRTQHALSRFVEHDPHHLVSAARYSAGPIDLARLILGGSAYD